MGLRLTAIYLLGVLSYMKTGERIRQIREKKKKTQDQLAEASGISKGFLSDVENDKRDIGSQALLRIANALGASVDYLLQGESKELVAERAPVVIPQALSQAAGELNLTYAQTLELLNAHDSVVARRSIRSQKEFTIDDWKNLHKALKRVFG